MPDWKQCEGELAGGEFPLERYLDGSEGSAVFLTRFASGRAVVKLVPAGHAQAGELVERWNRAAALRHPHLVRILAAGTGELAGTPLAYFVMEYAEENLAEVLRERPLTTDETRDMLQPVADALAYLHGQGLAHGNLKPSNILAVEDTVKISSESVAAGDPAADIRALGVTLVQALTQEAATVAPGGRDAVVEALPSPFREVARNCLHHDPRLRWSAGKIGDWLRSPEWPASTLPPPRAPVAKPAAGKPGLRYYVAAAAVLLLVAAIIWDVAMQRTATPPVAAPAASPVAPSPAAPPVAAPVAPPVAPPSASPSAPQATAPERPAESPRNMPAAADGITRRVLPDIPAKARDTIHGTAAVGVRVAVDPSGRVTEATLERGGSSYFGKLALEAARQWQFAPVEGAGTRNWILRFEIMRTGTQVILVGAGQE